MDSGSYSELKYTPPGDRRLSMKAPALCPCLTDR
jgi:hypothetical protein